MSDRPRLQFDDEWVEHLTCDPGARRWVSLPGRADPQFVARGGDGYAPNVPPVILTELLAECDTVCREPECDGLVEHACGRCLDGHPLVDVTAACDCDNGTVWTYRSHGPFYATDCPDCTNGQIPLGVWVADMPDDTMRPLLVREEPPSGPERDAITIDLDYRAWHFCRPVDLPNPVNRRGEWAVRLRRVS